MRIDDCRFLSAAAVAFFLFLSCAKPHRTVDEVPQAITLSPEDSFIQKIERAGITFPQKDFNSSNLERLRDTVLNDTRLVFPTNIFINPLTIHNSTFTGRLGLNSNLFHAPVFLSRCTFAGDDPVDFNVFFFDARFDSSAVFLDNVDPADMVFDHCLFAGPLTVAGYDTSKRDLTYQFCNIKKGIRFWYKNPQRLHDSTAYRTNRIFGRSLIFRNCTIAGKMDLSYSRFLSKQSIRFVNTFLPDTLDLSHVELNSTLDLTEALPNRRQPYCQLILNGEDVRKVRFQYNQFRLFFPPGMSDDEVSSIYELVKKGMQDNGFDDSYKKIDCEFQQAMVRRKDIDFSGTLLYKFFAMVTWGSARRYINPILNRLRPGALIDTIDRHWWNYGYQKEKILQWSVLFLLLFSLVNYFLYERLTKTYEVENLKRKIFPYTSSRALRFSRYFLLSIMYTAFVFFKVGIDLRKVTITNTAIFYLILVQYVIGLACTGFLLNWILKG